MTLIELMVVMAVMAVLVAAASPAYTTATANSRLDSFVNQFDDALRFARSEAIRRSEWMTMTTEKATNWATKVTLKVEDGSATPTISRVFPSFAPGYQFKDAPTEIRIDRSGRNISLTSTSDISKPISSTFSVCLGNVGKTLNIAPNGRLLVSAAGTGVCP